MEMESSTSGTSDQEDEGLWTPRRTSSRTSQSVRMMRFLGRTPGVAGVDQRGLGVMITRSLLQYPQEAELQEMIIEVNADGNGTIDFRGRDDHPASGASPQRPSCRT